MNNEEFLRSQERILEQQLAENYERQSEASLRSSYHNLAMSEETQKSIKDNINNTHKLLQSEHDLSESTLDNHMNNGMNFANNAYPYHVKNEIYKKTLNDIFAMLSEEQRMKYEMLFNEKYEEKLRDEVSYIQIFNKQKKTSNF